MTACVDNMKDGGSTCGDLSSPPASALSASGFSVVRAHRLLLLMSPADPGSNFRTWMYLGYQCGCVSQPGSDCSSSSMISAFAARYRVPSLSAAYVCHAN